MKFPTNRTFHGNFPISTWENFSGNLTCMLEWNCYLTSIHGNHTLHLRQCILLVQIISTCLRCAYRNGGGVSTLFFTHASFRNTFLAPRFVALFPSQKKKCCKYDSRKSSSSNPSSGKLCLVCLVCRYHHVESFFSSVRTRRGVWHSWRMPAWRKSTSLEENPSWSRAADS